MVSTFDGVHGVDAIASLPKDIQTVLNDCATFSILDDQARIALQTSRRKLILWMSTWFSDAKNATTRSEALWGAHAWGLIQHRLADIVNGIDQLQASEHLSPDPKKRLPWGKSIKWSHHDTSPILPLALALDVAVERLWTYSEMTFDSRHLVPGKTVCPPSHGQSLQDSIKIRPGAFLVYQGLQKEKGRFSLNIDLLGNGLASNPLNYRGPVTLEKVISYQLIYRNGEKEDFLIQALTDRESSATVGDLRPSKDPFEIMNSKKPFTSDVTCIQPAHFDQAYFFSGTRSRLHTSQGRSLAELLRAPRTSDEPERGQTLSVLSKFILALKLAELVQYLLGTPWLVSLGSDGMVECGSGDTSSFAISVPTLSLTGLYKEDPEALSEPSQLFNFGVLLIEIAIGKIDNDVTQSVEDPYTWASDFLPDVRKALGPEYSKACLFCIEDRRSISSFGEVTKCEQPGQNGWNTYLQRLLQAYHIQVVDRLREIRDIAKRTEAA